MVILVTNKYHPNKRVYMSYELLKSISRSKARIFTTTDYPLFNSETLR